MNEKEIRKRVNEKHGYTKFNSRYDELRKEWVSGQAYDTDKESLKRIAQRIHDTKPDYVFLTETAATPWGYFLKEVIRSAYPDDKIPLFYRVDSRRVKHYQEADKLDRNVKINCENF